MIETYAPKTGRVLKENGDVVNQADMLEAIYNALVVNKDAGVNAQLTGSTVDLRGLNANKPLASAVDVGTTYWSVDTDPNAESIEVSDGTNWAVV